MKKIISVLLSAIMVFSVGFAAFSANAFAGDTAAPAVQSVAEEKAIGTPSPADLLSALNGIRIPTSWPEIQNYLVKLLYKLADTIIDVLLKAINRHIPSVDFEDKAAYKNEQFYEGMDEFLTQPASNAVWKLGYASGSLQTGDELDGKHYVGGSLSFPESKAATAIYDDQRVRTIALSDNSGRGTVIFAVLDGFGISNTQVSIIRSMLADFAKENNIVSINISVLHQHSCVDTFGMNGDLVKMVLANPAILIANKKLNTDFKLLNGLNESFMNHLYDVTVKSVKDAVASMTEGKMYYSETNASQYIYDKREPLIYDELIHRLRFVPDNGDRETWICNFAIHCVGNGAAQTDVTGDYPYYMEKVINEQADANFIQIQGAELAITADNDPLNTPDEMPRLERLRVYGKALGELLINSDAPETEVEPLLNVRHAVYYVPISNQILEFAGKLGALTNTVVSLDEKDTQLEVATELGYMEIGQKLAVAIIPGELEPAIAYGGYLDASEAWNGKDFDYPSFCDIIPKDKELLVFGLTNDQIGYILEDNDYRSILSGVNEEIVATGDKAGSSTIEAFESLYNSIYR